MADIIIYYRNRSISYFHDLKNDKGKTGKELLIYSFEHLKNFNSNKDSLHSFFVLDASYSDRNIPDRFEHKSLHEIVLILPGTGVVLLENFHSWLNKGYLYLHSALEFLPK